MKLNIVSDIHYDPEVNDIDFSKFNYDADHFVFAGDLGTNSDNCNRFVELMPKTIEVFKRFYSGDYCFHYTLGNHDFWTNDYKSENFFVDTDVHVDKLVGYDTYKAIFISVPLFTFIDDMTIDPYGLGDYDQFCKSLRFPLKGSNRLFNAMWNNCFVRNVRDLDNTIRVLRNSEHKYEKIIVITHHVPLKELIKNSIMYGHKFNPYWISENVFQFMNNKPDIWIHGHSHEFCDMTIDGVRYIRNPLRDYNMNIMENAYKFTIEI